jgi:hypothetical protein
MQQTMIRSITPFVTSIKDIITYDEHIPARHRPLTSAFHARFKANQNTNL